MKEIDDLREIISNVTTWNYQRDLLELNLNLIEQAINDRYLELPLDADGEPIHLSDKLDNNLLVCGISATSAICYDDNNFSFEYVLFKDAHHAKPDTIEGALREFAPLWVDTYNPEEKDDLIKRFTARIETITGK